MHLARVQIKNFRNLADIDVTLSQHAILLGENRSGKSNFIYALRLLLDTTLPDSARYLKLADIWDGWVTKDEDPVVEVHLDFLGFDEDPNLLALLTDYRLASDPNIARLSYVFRSINEEAGQKPTEADFEFKIYGGGDESCKVSTQVRRRICLDVLDALRDAETTLGRWRSSPLRPLLEDAISEIGEKEVGELAATLNEAAEKLTQLEPINKLDEEVREQIATISGEKHDLKTKLGFAENDPIRLFRSLRVFIDEGRRGISDASLGAANVALLSLRLAEFEWRQRKNHRNFTLLAIEEPEAHLHPQLQRKIFSSLFKEAEGRSQSLFLTTHSPNIASVAPLRSIIHFQDFGEQGCKANSLADLPLVQPEYDDLERFINATRAEIFFSRGVVFVEGDAEEILIPVFAKALGYDLDELGISICNIGGTNFQPYAKLAVALRIPYSILTDWDPAVQVTGKSRAFLLTETIRQLKGMPIWQQAQRDAIWNNDLLVRNEANQQHIFLNNDTFETELLAVPALTKTLLEVLSEQGFGPVRSQRLLEWEVDHSQIDSSQLMAMIKDVRKGRFAQQLAGKMAGVGCPDYIRMAIENVINDDQ